MGQLNWSLRWRLSFLWFLEWGITGTVMTYMPVYLESIKVSKHQQSQLYAVMAIGLWVAPFVIGQIADRWLAIEKLLAISHFVGGLSLYLLAGAMELYDATAANFQSLVWLVGLFAVAYMPTVPLVSTLCFRHLPNPGGQFGKVRVWGTVGWMMGGLMLSFWLERTAVLNWLEGKFAHDSVIQPTIEFFHILPMPQNSDCFRMGAVLSFALGCFCVFLPHTPPAEKPTSQLAPVAVLGMFRDKMFSLFIAVCCLVMVFVVPIYNLAVPPLLTELGVAGNWVPAVMLVGQVSEFPALFMLSYLLRRIGPKSVFALGLAAWVLRYGLFAMGSPWALILLALALHGVCHVFLAIVSQLYLDARCPQDLRATAQNLLTFVTLGIGLPVGTILAGYLRTHFHGDPWKLFALPAIAAVVLLVFFWLTIRFPESEAPQTDRSH